MGITSRLREVAVLAAVVLGVLFVYGRCRDDRVSEWETRAQAAETLNSSLQERVNDLQAEADSLRSQAVAVVEVVVPRLSETDRRIAALPAPETAADTARDVIIMRLREDTDSLLVANRLLLQSNDRLQDALNTMTVARDSLLAVVEDRPGKRPWWLPEITVGAAGVMDDGRLAVKVPSLNVGWRIGL